MKEKLVEKNIPDYETKTNEILNYITNDSIEYLKKNQKISEKNLKQLMEILKKIDDDMPIQYIIGKHEFMNMFFTVNCHVFISSPETEILVKEVIKILQTNDKLSNILELCTGSGTIAISIAKNVSHVRILATDISNEALLVANKNLSLLNKHKNVKFMQSDLFENVHKKVDLIVANPPYGKSKEIRKKGKNAWKLYEPLIARDGGIDGLDHLKNIIFNAYKYLNNGGYLCLEIGHNQKEKIIQLLKDIGIYKNIYFKKDLEGNDRILICQI